MTEDKEDRMIEDTATPMQGAQVTYYNGPPLLDVIEESDSFYIVEDPDSKGSMVAIKKETGRVVTICAYIR